MLFTQFNKTQSPRFTAALSTIARTWKQAKHTAVNLSAGRDGDADVDTGRVDTAGKETAGRTEEAALTCVHPVCEREPVRRCRTVRGRSVVLGGQAGCTAETRRALQSNYPPDSRMKDKRP